MNEGRFTSATCPFYHKVLLGGTGKIKGIACQNVDSNLGFDIETIVRFESKEELKDFFAIFCADMAETCPYYQTIMRTLKK